MTFRKLEKRPWRMGTMILRMTSILPSIPLEKRGFLRRMGFMEGTGSGSFLGSVFETGALKSGAAQRQGNSQTRRGSIAFMCALLHLQFAAALRAAYTPKPLIVDRADRAYQCHPLRISRLPGVKLETNRVRTPGVPLRI